jgi:secondary thiamine-phosphate synthase enzyme
MLLGECDPRAVEGLATGALGLVRDRGTEEPEADLLPVHRRGERRLEPRDLLGIGPRQVADIALAPEAPELPCTAPFDLRGCSEPPAGVQRGEIGEALVDRGELELVLQPREMEVVLLVERRDEPVGFVPVRLELCRRGRRHASRRITAVREFEVETERKTELVNITEQVREAVRNGGDGSAALVYVPHTTAAVTINENIDPELVDDLERAFGRVVAEDWDWRHDDADGPNAPSHARSTIVGPQIMVPLSDGELALGTYQGIFFCEFDGPRKRKVYVTTLH